MGITYKRLAELLERHNITRMNLKRGAHISNQVLSKIDKDEYMSLHSLERIAKYLSKETSRKVQIGDLIEFK